MSDEVGAQAPVLERTITSVDMVAYAGATWDWHRMHYDAAYLAGRNLPAPVVDGQVFGALLAEQLQDWLGPRAFVRRLHMRYKNLVFAGERVRCTAEITAVTTESGARVLTVAAQVAVAGERPRVAVAPAGAEVLLP
ncbi:MAG: hypothetical protein EPN43_00720 [Jatrophihabitans sp.]|nr:MAG: hypothetical protein EPN43_00720 [Jatrophihabitans sp.]